MTIRRIYNKTKLDFLYILVQTSGKCVFKCSPDVNIYLDVYTHCKLVFGGNDFGGSGKRKYGGIFSAVMQYGGSFLAVGGF